MAMRTHSDVSTALFADERVRTIDWSHPALANLSDPARLIYTSLVDRCSEEAVDTLEAVDAVWRNREGYRRAATTTAARIRVLDAICDAVEELITAGLLLLLDDRSISSGWARRPWESEPS